MSGGKFKATGIVEEIRRIDAKPGEVWAEITLQVHGDKVVAVVWGRMAEELLADLQAGDELEVGGAMYYPPPGPIPCPEVKQ